MPTSGPMRILAAPAFSNATTNPYSAALYGELQRRDCIVREFSTRAVGFARWDIVHVHWPDSALNQANAPAAAGAVGAMLAKLVLVKARGAKLVWTIHNLQSHDGAYESVERWLWRRFLPLVDASISLSRAGEERALERFPMLATKPHFLIAHGHYRECYPNVWTREESRRRLGLEPRHGVVAFVGQIRPYKNLVPLIRTFRRAPDPEARLVLAGKPSDAATAAEILAEAAGDPRIRVECGLIPPDDMQMYLNACDLAVFPYREILNSGSAILALSFNRPVLVPRKGAMAELQQIAGSEWVWTYDGGLTPELLDAAVRWARRPRPQPCDLSPLRWENIAEQTGAAYRSLLTEGSGARVSPLQAAVDMLKRRSTGAAGSVARIASTLGSHRDR